MDKLDNSPKLFYFIKLVKCVIPRKKTPTSFPTLIPDAEPNKCAQETQYDIFKYHIKIQFTRYF